MIGCNLHGILPHNAAIKLREPQGHRFAHHQAVSVNPLASNPVQALRNILPVKFNSSASARLCIQRDAAKTESILRVRIAVR